MPPSVAPRFTTGTPVIPSTAAPTSMESIQPSVFSTQKRIENGQLLIIHNGVKYNAQGQVIK